MTKQTEKLLPCPFCGGDDLVIDDKAGITGKCYFITCYGGGIHGCVMQDYSYATKREAIKAWNTRTPNLSAEGGESILVAIAEDEIAKHWDSDSSAKQVAGYAVIALRPYLRQPNLSALDSDEAVEVVAEKLKRLQPRLTMGTEYSGLRYLSNAETYAKAAIQAVKGILGGKV